MKIRHVLADGAYKLTTSLLAFLAFAEFGNAFAKNPETRAALQAAPQGATENFWESTGGPQGGDVLSMVTRSELCLRRDPWRRGFSIC